MLDKTLVKRVWPSSDVVAKDQGVGVLSGLRALGKVSGEGSLGFGFVSGYGISGFKVRFGFMV